MIRIEYQNKEIKVTTENISKIYNVPLKVSIVKQVTNQEIWSCDLSDNSWASYPNNEMIDTIIYEGNKVAIKRKWNTLLDGDVLYKAFYLYCSRFERDGIIPHGLAIGTHDGDFGEWVPSVLEKKTRATLVEASVPQFKKLQDNFRKYTNVTLLNELVTSDGNPMTFFEGGKGYTNSVVSRVIQAWEKEKITSSLKNSVAINEIIRGMDRFDWLHLDVEGYDAVLIQSIRPSQLPLFIIFENNNILPDEKEQLNNYLKNKGYFLQEESVSTLAIKQ